MIDIHCHILPNIDDGADNFNASLEMATHAFNEGITTIVATPHHKNGTFENEKESILMMTNQLNEKLQQNDIKLTIVPGQEIRAYGEIIDDLEKGEILTYNNAGKYVLFEFPSNYIPSYASKLLYDIQLKGITPIIAHPERNSEIVENPDKLYNLVKNGALTQVTAASLTGHFGKKIKSFSYDLIKHNLAHFIASDAHNITNRSFLMRQAFDNIDRELDSSFHYYFQENAELLIEGKYVMVEPPDRVKKKKFLGIF